MTQNTSRKTSTMAAVQALMASDRSCAVSSVAGEAEVRLADLIASARWDNDWFTLWAVTQRCLHGAPTFDVVQNTLHRNALIGNVRHVYARHSNEMRVVAEFPLSDLSAYDNRLIENRKTRAKAALASAGILERPQNPAALWEPADGSTAQPDIHALLTEAAWPGVTGKQNRCRAELELKYGRQQATVVREAHAISLSADMLDGPEQPSALCVHAASLYLLMCASNTRLVAATVDLREKAFIPRLQVALPVSATAEWLRYGLAALSVAYESAAEEVEALSYDENIARRYLTTHSTPSAVQA